MLRVYLQGGARERDMRRGRATAERFLRNKQAARTGAEPRAAVLRVLCTVYTCVRCVLRVCVNPLPFPGIGVKGVGAYPTLTAPGTTPTKLAIAHTNREISRTGCAGG